MNNLELKELFCNNNNAAALVKNICFDDEEEVMRKLLYLNEPNVRQFKVLSKCQN